jgi:hypothetical protein
MWIRCKCLYEGDEGGGEDADPCTSLILLHFYDRVRRPPSYICDLFVCTHENIPLAMDKM